MTGNRHFLKENERRTREAVKEALDLKGFRADSATLYPPFDVAGAQRAQEVEMRKCLHPEAAQLAKDFDLDFEEVLRIYMRHGIEITKRIAESAVRVGRSFAHVADAYDALDRAGLVPTEPRRSLAEMLKKVKP